MNKFRMLAALVAGLFIFAACTSEVEVTREVESVRDVEVTREIEVTREVEVPAAMEPAAAVGARQLTIIVGAGEDTTSVNAFLPSTVAVRAGDTVTFELGHPNEPHTTSFLSGTQRPPVAIPIPDGGPTALQIPPSVAFPTRPPGGPAESYDGTGVASSGIMSNVPAGPPGTPANNAFVLTFDTPGTYEYVCLLHPPMTATITVLEANAAEAPSQGDIDGMAQTESDALIAQIGLFKAAGATSRSEIGPNGTTNWFVQAGTGGFPATAQSFKFLEEDLSIRQGDTVIWETEMFHNVTFHPGQPEPHFVEPIPQDRGRPSSR